LGRGQKIILNMNYKNPKISVVIPALDEEKFIEKCLFSILNQDFKDFELIVVNNNSTDNTAKIAKKFGARVIFEKNQGVGFARQRGFSEARGEIIATTDADVILPKNWLKVIFERFEKDKDLVGFGGLCNLYSGPFLVKIAARFFLLPIWLIDRIFTGGWTLMGANMAVRKSAFFKIGGFRIDFKMNEDTDLSQRLSKIGKVNFDPFFKIQTSGRRFTRGLISGMRDYFLNWIARVFFKKEGFVNEILVIREERKIFSINKGLVFSLSLILILVLSFLPWINIFSKNQKVALAKEKIYFTEKQIKQDLISLKKFLPPKLKIHRHTINEKNLFNI